YNNLAVGRLKVPFPGSSGLRKLGSSPHLLGICEETEESEFDKGTEQRHIVTRRSISGASVMPYSTSRLFVQPKLTKEDSADTILTYSNVRAIRRRQAIVSPDMAQRYEQKSSSRYHAVKPQRSTSCSSSETSDDDSERRLNFLASKYCCNYGNRRDNDDDPSKGNGGTSISSNNLRNQPFTGNTANASNTTSCNHDCQYSEQSSRYQSSLGLKLLNVTQVVHTSLHPICEIPATLFSHSLFPRLYLLLDPIEVLELSQIIKHHTLLFFGSKTVEEIITKWIDFSFLDLTRAEKQQAEHCTFVSFLIGEKNNSSSWTNAASDYIPDNSVHSASYPMILKNGGTAFENEIFFISN
ncbi:unnamed protein product, partial [Onchocerca flexuosa]|uniref:Pecanex-like protein n=1 Tax=Onchocerca flexuosa TaxID=387005 RepID=A0A183HCE4_9BILA